MKTHRLLVAGAALLLAPSASAQLAASSDLLEAADLERATVQELVLPAQAGEPFQVEVNIHGGRYELLLEPHSVRAASFQLLAQGEDGEYEAVEPAPEATYRGIIDGVTGSAVAGSLIDGQFHGLVRFADDMPLLGIQPLSSVGFGSSTSATTRREHLVYDTADLSPSDATCAAETLGADLLAFDEQPQFTTAAGGIKECEIACDADVEFYNKNSSSVIATEQDIANIMNNVAGIYLTDVGMGFAITTIIVRTAEPDPYTGNGGSSLLNQLTNHWSGAQAGVQRDIAHLFTGKNITGSTIGIAWLNSVCGNGNGYGVSQSKYTGNLANRTALTAHEIGHNFAAGHCNGAGLCAIMCSGLGGCSGNISSFYSGSKNTITNKINSSNCIDDAPPVDPPTLTSASPSPIGAYLPAELLVTGTDLSDVLQVKVGNSIMPPLKTSAGFSTLTVLQPVFREAGLNEVVVTTTAGAGGGVFVDVIAETAIDFDPPGVVVPGLSLFMPWSGGAGNLYFLNFGLDGSTTPVGGFDVLANAFTATSGTFGTAGTDFLFFDNVGSFGFLTLYFQVLVFDPSGTVFLGASDVKATLFI